MSDLNMTESFRTQCAELGVTEGLLEASLQRSKITPAELLTIDTTTSARNFRVSYLNKAGDAKWTHLFIVVAVAE